MVSTGATGMIGSDHKGGDFIEMLYSRSFLGRVNARLFKGLVANLDIPKQTGGIGFSWMNNETTDGTMSDPDTEPVNMGLQIQFAVPLQPVEKSSCSQILVLIV